MSAGPARTPCREPGCQRRAYHFLDAELARAVESDPAQASDPLVGRVTGGWLLAQRLAKSSSSEVYLALDTGPMGGTAAIKCLRFSKTAGTPEAQLERFNREVRTLGGLKNPCIVELFAAGEIDGMPWFAMEHLEGARSLRAELRRLAFADQDLPVAVVGRIVTQLLGALECAHNHPQRILHRDLQPDNIMLCRRGADAYHLELLDFGLAKFLTQGDEASVILGTPTYMAPEQLRAGKLGPWTDLYAVGVLTFELLTLRRAFNVRSRGDLLREKLDPSYDPCSRVGHLSLPPHVQRFFRQALSVDASARFQSAAEFRRAVSALVEAFDGARMPSRGKDLGELLSSADRAAIQERRSSTEAVRERFAEMERRLQSRRAELDERQRRLDADRRQLEQDSRLLEAERAELPPPSGPSAAAAPPPPPPLPAPAPPQRADDGADGPTRVLDLRGFPSGPPAPAKRDG